MTIIDALTSTVNFPLPGNRIAKALIDAGLIGESDYDKTYEKAVDMCMAGLLLTLITSADVSEDDVSIKLPERDQLLKVFTAIYSKWGIPNPLIVPIVKPTVKQVRFW